MTIPERGTERLELMLQILIEMTLLDDSPDSLLNRMRAAKNGALEQVPEGAAPLAALKAAVESELKRDSRFSDVSYSELREVATDFCDRTIAGVDEWEERDKERWREVCRDIIELSSSDM